MAKTFQIARFAATASLAAGVAVSLIFPHGASAAPKLKDLLNDNGKMLNLGIATANQSMQRQMPSLQAKAQERYGLDFVDGQVYYDEPRNQIVAVTELNDPHPTPRFEKPLCEQIASDIRSDVMRILDDRKTVDPFINTYILISGTPPALPPEQIAGEVKRRVVLKAVVNRQADGTTATCESKLNAGNVSFNVRRPG